MNKLSFLAVLVLVSLFSCSTKQEAETVQKKEMSENIWVCRNYKGGPQCVDEKELKPRSGLNVVKSKSGEAVLSVAGAGVTLENSEEKFREAGIKILEQHKNNKSVCEACYICPKYDMDLCFKIEETDFEKAANLGFRKKEMN
jgi:hypothetical protein